MIYQIKENKSTRHPSQHLIVHASYLTTLDLHDSKIQHRTFDRVQARAFRATRGLASRFSEMVGTDLQMFWSWVYSRCHNKIGTWLWCDDLVAHLVYLDVLSELQSGRLKYQRSVLSAKVSFMHCDTGQGHLTLLDRCNWWRCSSEEFAAGKPMLDALSDRVGGLLRWVVANDLGCLRVTAAGQSLAAYRHRLGPRRIFERIISRGIRRGQLVSEFRLWPRRHDNKEVTDLERAAYFGGPVHCYYIGKVREPVYVLDVRSLYPYIMQRYPMPCELLEVEDEPTTANIIERSKMECCIASVEVSACENVYPNKRDDGTYYLQGRLQCCLCGPELVRGIRVGEVRRIFRVAWYRARDLFSPFVAHFYGARERAEAEGETLEAELAKLILNSLPAKFGQMTGEWRDEKDEVSEAPWGYWYSFDESRKHVKFCRGLAGGVQCRAKSGESAHSFPAIPAYVCSYGRVLMDKLMSIARSNGKVYYSAIDSIHGSPGAWIALVMAGKVGNELGQLRHKGIYREAEYRGAGDYTLDGQVTRSGLPAGAEYIGNHSWRYRDHESAAELIAHGPAGSLVDRELTIKLPHQYRFGKVGKDGWVTPFTAEEL